MSDDSLRDSDKDTPAGDDNDDNDSIQDGNTKTGGDDIDPDEEEQGGLIDSAILNVKKIDNPANRGSQVALSSSVPMRNRGPRVTRFLYAYFMFGFFFLLFLCTIWGFLGTAYLFSGYPGIGLAYFGGLFIPSLWADMLLLLDFMIWIKNRKTPRRPLKINFSFCCNRITYKNGRDMVQGWYFILFLSVWFGLLLAIPAGSWALPVVSIWLSFSCILCIYDWELYYMKHDWNALYGIHQNPWRFLIVSATAQFIICEAIVIGHFFYHWRCIYEPEYYDGDQQEAHWKICHDWIPFEIAAVVYVLLIFVYWYKRFQGEPLNSNTLDKRVRYYLWFQALLLLITLIWIIVEILDGHVYVYDFLGFAALWFIAPVFFILIKSFKIA